MNLHAAFLRIRNLLGRGCKGEMVSMMSESGEMTMHLCEGCGDWYVDVRGVPMGKGKWSELPTRGVELAASLREKGYIVAANELHALAADAPQTEEEWSQYDKEES